MIFFCWCVWDTFGLTELRVASSSLLRRVLVEMVRKNASRSLNQRLEWHTQTKRMKKKQIYVVSLNNNVLTLSFVNPSSSSSRF